MWKCLPPPNELAESNPLTSSDFSSIITFFSHEVFCLSCIITPQLQTGRGSCSALLLSGNICFLKHFLLLPGSSPGCVSPRICRACRPSSTWSPDLAALTLGGTMQSASKAGLLTARPLISRCVRASFCVRRCFVCLWASLMPLCEVYFKTTHTIGVFIRYFYPHVFTPHPRTSGLLGHF